VNYLNAGPGEIDFTPLNNVTDYKLWINDLTSGAANIFPDLTAGQPLVVQKLSNSVTLPAGLISGHKYRLWIKARNTSGLGEWNDPFEFLRS
jgi:hypothetical protein